MQRLGLEAKKGASLADHLVRRCRARVFRSGTLLRCASPSHLNSAIRFCAAAVPLGEFNTSCYHFYFSGAGRHGSVPAIASGSSFRRGRGPFRLGGRIGVLQGQDHPHPDERRRRRRLCGIRPTAGAAHGRPPRRQARFHRPEHAGRRRPAGHQLSLFAGAAGRHHDRPDPLDGAARAAVRHQGRALRSAQIQLARQHRPVRRHVHRLAHLAGQDLGRHAGRTAHRRQHPAPARRWISTRRCSTSCSAPRSR